MNVCYSDVKNKKKCYCQLLYDTMYKSSNYEIKTYCKVQECCSAIQERTFTFKSSFNNHHMFGKRFGGLINKQPNVPDSISSIIYCYLKY